MEKPSLQLGLITTSLILAFTTSPVMAKTYYKWVDSNGSTHYTTTPPPKNAKKKGSVETYGAPISVTAPVQDQQQDAQSNEASDQDNQQLNPPAPVNTEASPAAESAPTPVAIAQNNY